MSRRFVVVHGHFYQPPRENPWTESVERQDSARPHHDWNERVAWECYIPNGRARVVDPERRILDLVNNYAYLSFNFGPTLLSWFEARHPRHYRRLIEGDKAGLARTGHGNAIAQAYNHMILPLAAPRDRLTQVLWGLEDFRARFGREPEAMWLPETACNLETLALLSEHGMRYVILSPGQALRARSPEGGRRDVSDGSIDPRRPYRVALPEGRSIAAFFYDGTLSSAIAFERLMQDAVGAAGRFEAAFDKESSEDQLVHVATDGESYGHHDMHADMGLAWLLKYELPRRGVEVTNYAAYLEEHPPAWEAELKPGPNGEGTAWSCAHGLGRWKEDCGCGREAGGSQAWRGPMRRAFDELREELEPAFERAGLFKDPWRARDEYARVLLARPAADVDAFLSRHLAPGREPLGATRIRALKWLELQRHLLLMYASCGWFFGEISGLESAQCLKYASRAVELARDLSGQDLEPRLLAALAEAPSNAAELKDGRGVYERLARPAAVTPDYLAAYFGLASIFSDAPDGQSLPAYRFQKGETSRRTLGATRLLLGTVAVESVVTLERWERAFLAVAQPDHLAVYVTGTEDPHALETARARLTGLRRETLLEGLEPVREPLFGNAPFTVRDLMADEREEIFSQMTADRMERLGGLYEVLYHELLPFLEQIREWRLPVPKQLRAGAEFATSQRLAKQIARALRGPADEPLDDLKETLEWASGLGLELSTPQTETGFSDLVARRLEAFAAGLSLEACRQLHLLTALGQAAGLKDWEYRAQNRLFELLRDKFGAAPEADGKAAEEGRALHDSFIDLCRAVRIGVDVHSTLSLDNQSRTSGIMSG